MRYRSLLTYPYDSLIEETAEVLGLPLETVKKIISFEFKIVSENYRN